jgi:hypothetical protein
MPQTKFDTEILAAALEGFKVQKLRIDAHILEIRQALGGGRTEATAPSQTTKPRKKRSAAVRRRMKIAQQLRWKKIKEAAEPPQTASPGSAKPKKRKLSAVGRKNIIEATKRRWAAVKAAK